jgi:hypothetical protein
MAPTLRHQWTINLPIFVRREVHDRRLARVWKSKQQLETVFESLPHAVRSGRTVLGDVIPNIKQILLGNCGFAEAHRYALVF